MEEKNQNKSREVDYSFLHLAAYTTNEFDGNLDLKGASLRNTLVAGTYVPSTVVALLSEKLESI